MKRSYFLAIVIAVLFAVTPSIAFADGDTYTLVGVETGVPTPCANPISGTSLSSFAGSANGPISGWFKADICHTSLAAQNPTITGGHLVISDGDTTAQRDISGGQIIPGGTSRNWFQCIERFAVVNGVLSGTEGSGTFSGQLTHYGYWSRNACHIYFATVVGMATLT